MPGIRVSVPIACFQKGMAREYRESAFQQGRFKAGSGQPGPLNRLSESQGLVVEESTGNLNPCFVFRHSGSMQKDIWKQ